MVLNENPTYYDVLDLRPEASPQEIREAYFRIKSTYNKDSVALYTLISPAEREDMLRLIEEAYDVLSSQEKRREYDRYHGLMDSRAEMTSQQRPAKKIVSIDRVPPMDMAEGDDLLVPPTTDFQPGEEVPGVPGRRPETLQSPGKTGLAGAAGPVSSPFEEEGPWTTPSPVMQAPAVATSDPGQAPIQSPQQPQQRPPQAPAAFMTPPVAAYFPPSNPPPVFSQSSPAFPPVADRPPVQPAPPDSFSALAREIEQETEWKGLLLRRIREAKRISIEEMAATTKISKTYILALEEDNYVKLPAAVYIRGFVTQIARVLKLPYNQVATAYMARYYQTHPNKN